jgi:hypothetical protein
MDAAIIYQNGRDVRYYDAFTREMRGGPDKIIAYINGAVCAVDRERGAKIAIPVSRWKLMGIGLACFLAALKGKGAAPRLLEPVSLPEPPPEAFAQPLPDALTEPLSEALAEPLPEAVDRKSPEQEWERLMKEMRDLSRQ